MKKLTVVVVDDAEDLRLLIRLALSRSEFFDVVGEAADGAEALRVVGRLQPDLVLLDMSMPVMDGMDALPHLRQVAPEAAVVIHSGFMSGALWPEAQARGAVGYLEKGLPAARLVSELWTLAGGLGAVAAGLEGRQKRLELIGVPMPVRAARAGLAATLEEWGFGDLISDVSLCVSEVATNSMAHAGGVRQVVVEVEARILRVSVWDPSPLPPVPQGPDDARPSGRGLEILGRLASHWGWHREGDGKVVFFEMPLTAGVEPATV